jgi:uncharacterized protein YjbI with pentapeptide repeats
VKPIFILLSIVSLIITFFSAQACGTGNQACDEASQHLAACSGTQAVPIPDCNSETADMLLGLDCDQLEVYANDPDKADLLGDVWMWIKNVISCSAFKGSNSDLNNLLDTKQCKDCDLVGACLSNAQLGGAKLDGADLSFTDLFDAYLDKSEMIGVNLFGASLDETSLVSANLSNAILSSAKGKAKLEYAILIDAQILGGDTNLSYSWFNYADLRSADFSKAYIYNGHFREAFLQDAKFIDSILTESTFSKAILSDVDFSRATLDNTNFLGADLSNAILVGADLTNASLHNAILEGADFSGADINGARWTNLEVLCQVKEGDPFFKCECALGSIGECRLQSW